MDFEHLKFETVDGVATITLNRPDVYNAFNDTMSFELQDALKQCTKDAGVRVVVITGAGKAFSSGQDLKASQADPGRSFKGSLDKRYNPIIRGIRNMPKPVICRLNGVAAGAGCSIALACDMIIASEEASLIEVFINIGLVPDSGSSFFLPGLIGYSRAFDLCTTGRKVSSQEALELGLIKDVVAASMLDERVKEITDYYKAAPTRAIGLIKKMLNKAMSASLEEMLDYESYCQEIAGSTEDHQEGVKAFSEKRKPDFKGR